MASYILWVIFYFNEMDSTTIVSEDALVSIVNILPSNGFWHYFISFLFTGINTVLIILLNNRYNIIRTRTLMPIFIFNILIGVWHQTHIYVKAHFALTLVFAAFFMFFEMYRNKNASTEAFTGSFLISLGCLLVKPLFILLPVFWIGFVMFQSFSLRTWLASLFGFLNPLILFFAINIYFNLEVLTIDHFSSGLSPVLFVQNLSVHELIYTFAMLIIILVSSAGLFPNLRNDSIQTRSRLSFIAFFSIVLFVISIFNANDYKAIMPIVGFGFSIILSHPLSLRKGNFFSIVFILFVVLNLAFVLSKLLF